MWNNNGILSLGALLRVLMTSSPHIVIVVFDVIFVLYLMAACFSQMTFFVSQIPLFTHSIWLAAICSYHPQSHRYHPLTFCTSDFERAA